MRKTLTPLISTGGRGLSIGATEKKAMTTWQIQAAGM
jgi:hypothetical protein